MRIFVTVGSTKFDDLIQAILDPLVLASLKRKGYNHVVIQCGASFTEFDREILDNGLNIQREEVTIDVWRFKPSLKDEFDNADLVISHAGSGTILEVLRLGKPLIVVPNTTLMDNHQAELAEALDQQDYLRASSVSGLSSCIDNFNPTSLKGFPPRNMTAFATLLDEEMGF